MGSSSTGGCQTGRAGGALNGAGRAAILRPSQPPGARVLNRLDDYPIHQAPVPVAQPGSSDANFYDRYFFNGYTRAGDLFFAAALGSYPNRRVMDAAFSVVRDGVQQSVHASRLAPDERTETEVGPIRVEVDDPMRVLRLDVGDNELGVTGELCFTARAGAIEEPRVTRVEGGRVTMDSTRFTQFGSWSGELIVDGQRLEIDDDEVLGCRDRSWGVRPVGERPTAAPPGPAPQLYWVWAPIQFEDRCILLGTFQDADGRPWHAHGAQVPTWASQVDANLGARPAVKTLHDPRHTIEFEPGTRRARAARLAFDGSDEVVLEPLLTFQMCGIGYFSAEWGHGLWKGEQAVGVERWELAKLDPLDPRHVHVQQVVRARMGEREGIGVLEQLILGPHGPSGFRGLLDGA
jgi:hypothetical protein